MVEAMRLAVLFSDGSIATATYVDDGWVYNCMCGKPDCEHVLFIKKMLGDKA